MQNQIYSTSDLDLITFPDKGEPVITIGADVLVSRFNPSSTSFVFLEKIVCFMWNNQLNKYVAYNEKGESFHYMYKLKKEIIELKPKIDIQKPCPFCGDHHSMILDEKDNQYTISCLKCDIKMSKFTLEGLQKTWNDRA